MMEQLILETIAAHVKDKKMIRNSQHGFTNGKSYLTTFYDEMTGLVDQGRAVAIVCFDINKSFVLSHAGYSYRN
ncbi:hypothetical protein WISP_117598 [Willisornis vidua]|uniref:Reverse transcriptase domain-containing protein n=1 Tax=Willisornis vidua TaxID=1566151 RepID=A0ABQ9CUG6_9PASS|nr:hypothetical protein WISP_117598 [Willisornis vidua]